MPRFFNSLVIFLVLVCGSANAQLTREDFLAKPGMIDAKVSPNGKHVATVWNIEDSRYVMIYDLDEGKIITKFGDNIIRPYGVSWANDERLLVKLLVPYRTAKVRRESESKDDFDIDDYFMFGRVVSTDINGEGLVELMNDERSAKRNVNLARIPHYLPKDKDHILMNSIRKERLAQFKVNVNTGESEHVATGGRRTIAFVNDKDGKLLYRYDYKRIARMVEIFEFTDEEEWELIEEIYFDEDDESKNKIDIRDLVGERDGKLVYRKKNKETGFNELVTLDEGKQVLLASEKDKDIVRVITSGFNNEVIGYVTLTDIFRSKFFSEKTQKKYDQAAKYFNEENFGFVNLSKDDSRAIIVSWGMNNPTTYFNYDFEADKLQTLNYAYSSLPKDQLAAGIKVQYYSRDKMLINAYIYLPLEFDGTQAMPLVVMPHGGPQARDVMSYDDYAQFIATRGYLVIKPNFRGSTGYGKAFEEAGYKEWGGKMQEDLEDVVTFLSNEGLVDKNRVCLVGISYGGYAALMGLVKTPDMYQCAISINGVTHLPDIIEYDLDKFESQEIKDFVLKSIGDPKTDMDMLVARSPALQADKIKAPVLLIQGDEDEVVPYDQAEDMYDALVDNKKWVRMITLRETGHNPFHYKQDIEDVYEETEAFLEEFLPTNAKLKAAN